MNWFVEALKLFHTIGGRLTGGGVGLTWRENGSVQVGRGKWRGSQYMPEDTFVAEIQALPNGNFSLRTSDRNGISNYSNYYNAREIAENRYQVWKRFKAEGYEADEGDSE